MGLAGCSMLTRSVFNINNYPTELIQRRSKKLERDASGMAFRTLVLASGCVTSDN